MNKMKKLQYPSRKYYLHQTNQSTGNLFIYHHEFICLNFGQTVFSTCNQICLLVSD